GGETTTGGGETTTGGGETTTGGSPTDSGGSGTTTGGGPTDSGGSGTDTGGGTDTGSGGLTFTVPHAAGMKLSALQAQAKKAGRTAHLTTAISGTVPAGKIVSQVQQVGTPLPKDATMDVVVSIGEPQVAFDNGRDIFVADGYSGGSKR